MKTNESTPAEPLQASELKFTPEELSRSAAKYRREFVQIPITGLKAALAYFQLRTGIQGSETVGELSGSIEMAPYNAYRVDQGEIGITGRELKTYLGSAVKRFDPNQVWGSIYGSRITQGEGLKNVPVTVQIVSYLAAKISKSLRLSLFDAVRNPAGNSTKDLFDGFDTITAAEVTAGKISEANGNLFRFTEAITSANCVDMLRTFLQAADDELLGQGDGEVDPNNAVNLYVPRQIVYAYCEDYKSTTGNSPVYDKFNQVVVEGFPYVRLCPFAGKAKSNFLQLSTRNNMLLGTDLTHNVEKMAIEKHHEFLLSFVATMVFGAQFESISKEALMVGKLYEASPSPTNPETPGPGK